MKHRCVLILQPRARDTHARARERERERERECSVYIFLNWLSLDQLHLRRPLLVGHSCCAPAVAVESAVERPAVESEHRDGPDDALFVRRRKLAVCPSYLGHDAGSALIGRSWMITGRFVALRMIRIALLMPGGCFVRLRLRFGGSAGGGGPRPSSCSTSA